MQRLRRCHTRAKYSSPWWYQVWSSLPVPTSQACGLEASVALLGRDVCPGSPAVLRAVSTGNCSGNCRQEGNLDPRSNALRTRARVSLKGGRSVTSRHPIGSAPSRSPSAKHLPCSLPCSPRHLPVRTPVRSPPLDVAAPITITITITVPMPVASRLGSRLWKEPRSRTNSLSETVCAGSWTKLQIPHRRRALKPFAACRRLSRVSWKWARARELRPGVLAAGVRDGVARKRAPR